MQSPKKKQHPHSVKRKILAGFFLAFVAILLAFTITNYSFRDIMQTVEELSEPSEKLSVLNQVFQEIATLDQLQRAEAIKNPQKPYNAFLNQSQTIVNNLDSMALLDWDTAQIKRILSMKEILLQRDELFLEYLKLKSNLIDNKTLTRRIDTLSSIIEQKKIEIDTSVVSTQRKTTTTYVRDSAEDKAKDEKSFIGKLFSKKKKNVPEEETMQIKVLEELSVIVDTLAIAKQNKVLEEVEKIVRDLEADHRTQNKKLLSRELELINANSLFINQLLSILHEVEREELNIIREKNTHANALVTESISRISILLLVFFLGAALLVYLIWMDISKSNYYRDQLEKARDEAEELSKIKERFLANMSHEIRTPLQSILGFAEQIKQQQTGGNNEAVNAIYSSSEHLLHIVNEVLDYSRISSGNFTIAKEPFNLLDVVKEIESAIHIQADQKKLTLLLDIEQAANYTLSGDSFRLRQILYNIAGNAVKFTSKGFVKLTVRTREEEKLVHCEFEIMDTGIGIKPDDLSKIFNQFEQANSSIARQYGGTGLGLTIVKSLIEAQGGSLIVESEPGHGSVFTVRLAFEKTTDGTNQLKATPSAISTNIANKVIVVDDDQMILRLCGLILQKYSLDHILYHDAEKLLDANVDSQVTHILMDIRMPKINGIELCQALRKKYPSSTQFIALTAHVFPQERQALLDQGFDRALSKPFHEIDLLNLLGVNAQRIKDEVTPIAIADTLDLRPLRKMTLDDEDLFQTVIQQFMEETQHDLDQLERKLLTSERSAIREIIHRLAGRIGQIGVLPLSLKLKELEGRMEKGDDMLLIAATLNGVKLEVKEILINLQKMTNASKDAQSEEIKVKK